MGKPWNSATWFGGFQESGVLSDSGVLFKRQSKTSGTSGYICIYIYIYIYVHRGSNLYNSQVSNESMSPAMSPSHSVLQLGQTRSLEARRLVIERLLGLSVEGAPGLALAISATVVILGFATLNVVLGAGTCMSI